MLDLIGAFFIVLAAILFVAPFVFFNGILVFIGIILLVAAFIKTGQFLVGRSKRGYRFTAILLMLADIALDVGLAILLFNRGKISVDILLAVFCLVFIGDGALQIGLALRSPTSRTRLILLLNGGVSALIGVVGIFRGFGVSAKAISLLLALKFLIFGISMVLIAFRSKKDEMAVLFTDVDSEWFDKKPGEIYACYFGAAFHLGVYIGNDQMVHYRDDNVVHLTSWADYLMGREPQHWVYPDIKAAPLEQIIKYSKAQVGKESKYNFMTNNCEHFVIECKTAGKVRDSRYAQIPAGFESVKDHPIVGGITGAYARIVEWMAYHLGGALGKKASLKIRQFSSYITLWLISGTGE